MSTKEQTSTEVSRWLHNLSVMPGWNGTTTKEVAKQLLETDFVFCNGDIRDIIAAYRGLGVYHISTKKRP